MGSALNKTRWLLLLLAPVVCAQETTSRGGPPPADEEVAPRPRVTITQQGDEVIKEYRINGRLYMVEVDPAKGYPYYLVDTDGDGRLETHHVELTEDLLVPNWVIFRW